MAGVVAASNMAGDADPGHYVRRVCHAFFRHRHLLGTFGILIPIIVSVCETAAPELTVTALSAILAGSVFGDHCSPISDTTIMSSTGAGCAHIDHVSTQLPYSLTVASVCVAGYLVAGFSAGLGFGISLLITDVISLLLLAVLLLALPKSGVVRKSSSKRPRLRRKNKTAPRSVSPWFGPLAMRLSAGQQNGETGKKAALPCVRAAFALAFPASEKTPVSHRIFSQKR